MNLLKYILGIGFLVTVLVVCFLGLMFGISYLVSSLFHFTLLQSVYIVLAATFVVSFIILVFSVTLYYNDLGRYTYSEFDDDDDELFDEYDEDYEHEIYERPHTVHQADKIGRNRPCPCGSGKKYKNCCGKTENLN